jgi:hypothetical protein
MASIESRNCGVNGIYRNIRGCANVQQYKEMWMNEATTILIFILQKRNLDINIPKLIISISIP